MGGPQPQNSPRNSPRSSPSGGPDLAEILKSAYGDPLPLDLPNLDEVQRNFAKLCERVEAALDRLDSHWIDDAHQSTAQSKKEGYAAGARLLGRLGKSMTRMLKRAGRRHQNLNYGDTRRRVLTLAMIKKCLYATTSTNQKGIKYGKHP